MDFDYDDKGQLIGVQGENRDRINYEYDERGQLRKLFSSHEDLVLEPKYLDGGILTGMNVNGDQLVDFDYNAQGRIGGIWDGRSNRTGYEYDDFGLAIYRQSVDTGLNRYHYDESNNLVTSTNGLNETIRYDYDMINQLISTSSSNHNANISYRSGQLESLSTSIHRQQHRYDEQGRLITKRQGIDEHEYEMGYTYNEKGQLKSKRLYDDSRLAYSYDENGRMVSVFLISPTGVKNIDYKTTTWQ